jgi:hypothetical protein
MEWRRAGQFTQQAKQAIKELFKKLSNSTDRLTTGCRLLADSVEKTFFD